MDRPGLSKRRPKLDSDDYPVPVRGEAGFGDVTVFLCQTQDRLTLFPGGIPELDDAVSSEGERAAIGRVSGSKSVVERSQFLAAVNLPERRVAGQARADHILTVG